MRLTINITKQHLVILSTIIVLCSAAMIYAMNSGDPNVMGHSGDEIVSLPFSKLTPSINTQSGTFELTNGNLDVNTLTLDNLILPGNQIRFGSGTNYIIQHIYTKNNLVRCAWNGWPDNECVSEGGVQWSECTDHDINEELGRSTNQCEGLPEDRCSFYLGQPVYINYETYCIGYDLPLD